MSTSPAKIGHNSHIDFDLATDFVDVGPLSGRKDLDSKQLTNFRHAIRTQGNNNIRQRSISNMLERARANAAVSHAEFRILDRIAQRCRGGFRYTIEPQDTLGFFCGIEHRQSVARMLPSLIDLGFVVSIDVPSRTGGRPRRFYTVVCTGGDRTGTSRSDLAFEARRRNLELMDDEAATRLADAIVAEMEVKKAAEAMHQDVASTRETERPMQSHAASTGSMQHQDALPKQHHVALERSIEINILKEPKQHHDALDGSLHPQGAKQHHVDVSVYIPLEGDSYLPSLGGERGVRGENHLDIGQLASPSAPPPNEGSTTKVRSSAQKSKPEIDELSLEPIGEEVVEAEVLNPDEYFGAVSAQPSGPVRGAAPVSERTKPKKPFPKAEDQRARLWAYCLSYGAAQGMDESTARNEAEQWSSWAKSHDKRFVSWEAAWRTWVANWRKWNRNARPGQKRRSDADIINDL